MKSLAWIGMGRALPSAHVHINKLTGLKLFFFKSFMLLALTTLSSKALFAAPSAELAITPITETEEIVFRWVSDKCNNEHVPDSPARAFRAVDDTVFLFATHYTNQPLTGWSLDTVRPNCLQGFQASMQVEPEKFNARIWLQTFYTDDGHTIYSIGSSDYHGIWFDNCTTVSKDSTMCWWSSLILAISRNAGKTFSTETPPDHIIARAPHNYSKDPGRPVGFFTSSNIIKRDGFYHTLIYTFGYKEQRAGNCLTRTNDLSSARSWRAWDGKSYSVRFVSPQNPASKNPDLHACVPVAKLTEPVRSLLWHEPSAQYIAVFSTPRRIKGASGEFVRVHFRFATSPDLMDWSSPQDIITLDSPLSCQRGIAAVGYPSIIDPSSNDRNFGTIDNFGYLYFTRFNGVKDCRMTMDRDLVRIPIRIEDK